MHLSSFMYLRINPIFISSLIITDLTYRIHLLLYFRVLSNISSRFFRHGIFYITESYPNVKILSFRYMLLWWKKLRIMFVLIQFQHVVINPCTYVCNKSFNWRWTIISFITWLQSHVNWCIIGITMLFNIIPFNNFTNYLVLIPILVVNKKEDLHLAMFYCPLKHNEFCRRVSTLPKFKFFPWFQRKLLNASVELGDQLC